MRTLSEGKYINEEYEFHVQLNSSSLILLTKMKLLSLKKTVLSNVWDTEWIENWSNCERVERMNGKLRITIKVYVFNIDCSHTHTYTQAHIHITFFIYFSVFNSFLSPMAHSNCFLVQLVCALAPDLDHIRRSSPSG